MSYCLLQAFAKSQTIQKVSQNTGVEREERLLEESAHKEANFATALHELERELKQVIVLRIESCVDLLF